MLYSTCWSFRLRTPLLMSQFPRQRHNKSTCYMRSLKRNWIQQRCQMCSLMCTSTCDTSTDQATEAMWGQHEDGRPTVMYCSGLTLPAICQQCVGWTDLRASWVEHPAICSLNQYCSSVYAEGWKFSCCWGIPYCKATDHTLSSWCFSYTVKTISGLCGRKSLAFLGLHL